MPIKKPKKSKEKQPVRMGYWEHLIENFSAHSKVWLEDYEVNNSTPHKKNSPIYASKEVSLDAELSVNLTKFAKKNNFLITTVLHGAWGLLLNRYSTTDDIIYGMGCFSEKKTSKELSFQAPLLPIRSTIHDEETIFNYLNNTAEKLRENDKHIKSFTRETKNSAAFKNLFNYLLLSPAKTAPGKNKKSYSINPNKFPLVLVINDDSLLKLTLLFNTKRFSPESAVNLIEHYLVILEKIIADPEQLVTHYSILTSEERHELLHEWSKTQQKRLLLKKNECVHELFIQQARRTPDYIAITHNETRITYKELDEFSNQIAHLLAQRKIRFGDTIAVLMERTPLLIATMLAIFKIGAVYVPINPKYSDENIKFIIEDSETHLILVNNTQRIAKDFLYKTVIFDESLSAMKHLPKQLPIVRSDRSERNAYVIYTSGTTGEPKGVIIKHSSLVNLVTWYKTCFDLSPSDRASQFASQGFDTFFSETIPFLLSGASVNIVDDHVKFTPTLFMPWLAREKITICDLPTAYAQILLNLPWPDKLSLRTVKLGGEMLTQYPSQLYPFDIWNVYGPAEATIETTYFKIYHANTLPSEQEHKHVPPPIGKAILNTEVYVVDQHMEPVPIGNVGELLIAGANLAVGYLNRPQLTRDKFIRNIFSENPDAKMFRTGDLVRWLNDGNLEFVGRIDHQIKISGYRIEISEIETALNQYPDVNEVVVIAKELTNGQKTLIAYLVPNLDKIRIPYQERCLVSINNIHYLQVLSEDISKSGIAVTGATEELAKHQTVRLNLKLPGFNEALWLTGKVIWQREQRAGIQFDQTNKQLALLQKSIEYYLSTHNLMETLQSAAAKRSLRSALKKKLPDYMVPTVFSTLTSLPLTFNGKVDWRLLPPPKDFERLLERSYAEPRNATEQEIYAMWCDILKLDSVSITDNFFDIGGNSQCVAELSVRILKKFNVAIPERIFFELPFIPIMAEYIDSKGTQYTYKTSIQDEIARDSVLHDDVMPTKKLSPTIHNPQGILLTGAAGFLGIYLLRELLLNSEAKIYCLIRKGKFESIASRLISNIDRYELSDEISLANRRIVMIESDIGNDQFGIPVELYNNLAGKIDLIYHCGAQINTITSYTNLRTSNVQGTLEIIKFALHHYDKPIHYISTLAAANKVDETQHILEEFPDANSSQLIGGYAISKWVSERLLTQLKNRGLPISIYRSGHIWGQSDTGITNINDALLLLVKGCIQLGFAPNWHEKIRLLPVDFVSNAIINISLQKIDKSNVYHIDHPNGIMWTDLIAWLNDYGYTIKICSHKEWRQHLTKIGRDNAIFPFLPHYLSQNTSPKAYEIDMNNTISALKTAKIAYPELNDRLLRLYMKYLCEIGFLPMPEGRRKQIFI